MDLVTLRALVAATNSSSSREYRVRSYLAANCAQCHQPGGVAQVAWDARISTPLPDTGIIFRCDNNAGTIKFYSFTLFASGGSARLYKNLASDMGTVACDPPEGYSKSA